MRGVPGSGKSFRAHQLVNGDKNCIFSADKWFSQDEDPEEYKRNWAPDKLFIAHNWCKSQLEEAMKKNISPVVVDNTNIKLRDFAYYIELANTYKYQHVIEESQSPWWISIKKSLIEKNTSEIEQWAKKLADGFDYNGIIIKNTHGVPEAPILRMLNSYQFVN